MIRLTTLTLALAAAAAIPMTRFQEPEAAQAEATESPWPEAKAEDVADIDSIITALYDVISGDKGEPRDWDRFRSLFHPEQGRLIPLAAEGGRWRALGMTPDGYADQAKVWTQSTAFWEREIARRTERFGGLAHVWTTYAGFNAADAETPFVRGVNSVQLMFDGTRWSILSITWDAETPTQALPAKYLPGAEGESK